MPRYADEDDDDRPRRRRYEDDEEDEDEFDDRPRRRRKPKPSGPPVALIVAGLIGGLGLMGIVAIGLIGFLAAKKDAPPPVAVGRQPFGVPPPPIAPPKLPGRPAVTPAPAGPQQITLTAARRATGFAGKPTLEIDYRLSGGRPTAGVVVRVKSAEGVTDATVFGMMGGHFGQNSGTWTLEKIGFGGFAGRLEIWVEERLGVTTTISNTLVLE